MSNTKGAKAVRTLWMALVLIFLYAPILVMIALSFNASVSRSQWTGFTFDWYVKLFHDPTILGALRTTLEVAVIATVVSTVIGTLGAIGMHSMNTGMASALINVSYLPMTTPDIVTGVSLMLMFIFAKVPLGEWTMIMAHISFDQLKCTKIARFSTLWVILSCNFTILNLHHKSSMKNMDFLHQQRRFTNC